MMLLEIHVVLLCYFMLPDNGQVVHAAVPEVDWQAHLKFTGH